MTDASRPIATGSVASPGRRQQPTGWLWDQLNAADSKDEVLAVRETATRLGYAPEGQLQTAIAQRLAAFDAPANPEG